MDSGSKVLIVEDDKPLRDFYRMALALEGFDVRDADNGVDALRLLDADPPDLVVLDLLLPGLDGFSVAEELSRGSLTRHIPIVVVTGWTRDVSRVSAACLLRKPVTPEELVATVRRYLKH